MANATCPSELAPEVISTPLAPLLPFIADFHLALLLPPLAYWALSGFYFVLDTFELCQACRIHTPAETRQRNRVSPWVVLRTVVIQQSSQVAWGLFLGHLLGKVQYTGHERFDVAWWAGRVGRWRQTAPLLLAVLGIDGSRLAFQVEDFWQSFTQPVMLKHVFGFALDFTSSAVANATSFPHSFDRWTAVAIYYYLVPAVRFAAAVLVADAWQYFWHRVMHSNKYLYRVLDTLAFPCERSQKLMSPLPGTFHAVHHQFVVPYAFGAFYDTWAEGFLMDGIGTTLALGLSGLTTRQAMWFNTISTLKGVDDHGGYVLPWNPLQWLGQQDSAFHDVHHQSWGIKACNTVVVDGPHTRVCGMEADSTILQSNYSQLYLTLWDHLCGTVNSLSTEEQQRQYSKFRELAEARDRAGHEADQF